MSTNANESKQPTLSLSAVQRVMNLEHMSPSIWERYGGIDIQSDLCALELAFLAHERSAASAWWQRHRRVLTSWYSALQALQQREKAFFPIRNFHPRESEQQELARKRGHIEAYVEAVVEQLNPSHKKASPELDKKQSTADPTVTASNRGSGSITEVEKQQQKKGGGGTPAALPAIPVIIPGRLASAEKVTFVLTACPSKQSGGEATFELAIYYPCRKYQKFALYPDVYSGILPSELNSLVEMLLIYHECREGKGEKGLKGLGVYLFKDLKAIKHNTRMESHLAYSPTLSSSSVQDQPYAWARHAQLKAMVERAENKVEAKESRAKESEAKESKAKESKAKESEAKKSEAKTSETTLPTVYELRLQAYALKKLQKKQTSAQHEFKTEVDKDMHREKRLEVRANLWENAMEMAGMRQLASSIAQAVPELKGDDVKWAQREQVSIGKRLSVLKAVKPRKQKVPETAVLPKAPTYEIKKIQTPVRFEPLKEYPCRYDSATLAKRIISDKPIYTILSLTQHCRELAKRKKYADIVQLVEECVRSLPLKKNGYEDILISSMKPDSWAHMAEVYTQLTVCAAFYSQARHALRQRQNAAYDRDLNDTASLATTLKLIAVMDAIPYHNDALRSSDVYNLDHPEYEKVIQELMSSEKRIFWEPRTQGMVRDVAEFYAILKKRSKAKPPVLEQKTEEKKQQQAGKKKEEQKQTKLLDGNDFLDRRLQSVLDQHSAQVAASSQAALGGKAAAKKQEQAAPKEQKEEQTKTEKKEERTLRKVSEIKFHRLYPREAVVVRGRSYSGGYEESTLPRCPDQKGRPEALRKKINAALVTQWASTMTASMWGKRPTDKECEAFDKLLRERQMFTFDGVFNAALQIKKHPMDDDLVRILFQRDPELGRWRTFARQASPFRKNCQQNIYCYDERGGSRYTPYSDEDMPFFPINVRESHIAMHPGIKLEAGGRFFRRLQPQKQQTLGENAQYISKPEAYQVELGDWEAAWYRRWNLHRVDLKTSASAVHALLNALAHQSVLAPSLDCWQDRESLYNIIFSPKLTSLIERDYVPGEKRVSLAKLAVELTSKHWTASFYSDKGCTGLSLFCLQFLFYLHKNYLQHMLALQAKKQPISRALQKDSIALRQEMLRIKQDLAYRRKNLPDSELSSLLSVFQAMSSAYLWRTQGAFMKAVKGEEKKAQDKQDKKAKEVKVHAHKQGQLSHDKSKSASEYKAEAETRWLQAYYYPQLANARQCMKHVTEKVLDTDIKATFLNERAAVSHMLYSLTQADREAATATLIDRIKNTAGLELELDEAANNAHGKNKYAPMLFFKSKQDNKRYVLVLETGQFICKDNNLEYGDLPDNLLEYGKPRFGDVHYVLTLLMRAHPIGPKGWVNHNADICQSIDGEYTFINRVTDADTGRKDWFVHRTFPKQVSRAITGGTYQLVGLDSAMDLGLRAADVNLPLAFFESHSWLAWQSCSHRELLITRTNNTQRVVYVVNYNAQQQPQLLSQYSGAEYVFDTIGSRAAASASSKAMRALYDRLTLLEKQSSYMLPFTRTSRSAAGKSDRSTPPPYGYIEIPRFNLTFTVESKNSQYATLATRATGGLEPGCWQMSLADEQAEMVLGFPNTLRLEHKTTKEVVHVIASGDLFELNFGGELAGSQEYLVVRETAAGVLQPPMDVTQRLALLRLFIEYGQADRAATLLRQLWLQSSIDLKKNKQAIENLFEALALSVGRKVRGMYLSDAERTAISCVFMACLAKNNVPEIRSAFNLQYFIWAYYDPYQLMQQGMKIPHALQLSPEQQALLAQQVEKKDKTSPYYNTHYPPKYRRHSKSDPKDQRICICVSNSTRFMPRVFPEEPSGHSLEKKEAKDVVLPKIRLKSAEKTALQFTGSKIGQLGALLDAKTTCLTALSRLDAEEKKITTTFENTYSQSKSNREALAKLYEQHTVARVGRDKKRAAAKKAFAAILFKDQNSLGALSALLKGHKEKMQVLKGEHSKAIVELLEKYSLSLNPQQQLQYQAQLAAGSLPTITINDIEQLRPAFAEAAKAAYIQRGVPAAIVGQVHRLMGLYLLAATDYDWATRLENNIAKHEKVKRQGLTDQQDATAEVIVRDFLLPNSAVEKGVIAHPEQLVRMHRQGVRLYPEQERRLDAMRERASKNFFALPGSGKTEFGAAFANKLGQPDSIPLFSVPEVLFEKQSKRLAQTTGALGGTEVQFQELRLEPEARGSFTFKDWSVYYSDLYNTLCSAQKARNIVLLSTPSMMQAMSTHFDKLQSYVHDNSDDNGPASKEQCRAAGEALESLGDCLWLLKQNGLPLFDEAGSIYNPQTSYITAKAGEARLKTESVGTVIGFFEFMKAVQLRLSHTKTTTGEIKRRGKEKKSVSEKQGGAQKQSVYAILSSDTISSRDKETIYFPQLKQLLFTSPDSPLYAMLAGKSATVRQSVADFFADKNKESRCPTKSFSASEIRQLTTCKGMLSDWLPSAFLRKKITSDYGLNDQPDLETFKWEDYLALPRKGGATEPGRFFENPFLVLVYMTHWYHQYGVPKAVAKYELTRLADAAKTEEGEKHQYTTKAALEFSIMTGYSAEMLFEMTREKNNLFEQHWPKLQHNTKVISAMLKKAATHIQTSHDQTERTPSDLYGMFGKHRIYLQSTPHGPAVMPLGLTYSGDNAGVERSALMRLEKNLVVKPFPKIEQNTLSAEIEAIVLATANAHPKNPVKALVDGGGRYSRWDNEAVAKALRVVVKKEQEERESKQRHGRAEAKQHQPGKKASTGKLAHIERILFFNKAKKVCCLDVRTGKITLSNKVDNNTFVFFDEAHTGGTHFDLGPDANIAVTSNNKTALSTLLQAIGRGRFKRNPGRRGVVYSDQAKDLATLGQQSQENALEAADPSMERSAIEKSHAAVQQLLRNHRLDLHQDCKTKREAARKIVRYRSLYKGLATKAEKDLSEFFKIYREQGWTHRKPIFDPEQCYSEASREAKIVDIVRKEQRRLKKLWQQTWTKTLQQRAASAVAVVGCYDTLIKSQTKWREKFEKRLEVLKQELRRAEQAQKPKRDAVGSATKPNTTEGGKNQGAPAAAPKAVKEEKLRSAAEIKSSIDFHKGLRAKKIKEIATLTKKKCQFEDELAREQRQLQGYEQKLDSMFATIIADVKRFCREKRKHTPQAPLSPAMQVVLQSTAQSPAAGAEPKAEAQQRLAVAEVKNAVAIAPASGARTAVNQRRAGQQEQDHEQEQDQEQEQEQEQEQSAEEEHNRAPNFGKAKPAKAVPLDTTMLGRLLWQGDERGLVALNKQFPKSQLSFSDRIFMTPRFNTLVERPKGTEKYAAMDRFTREPLFWAWVKPPSQSGVPSSPFVVLMTLDELSWIEQALAKNSPSKRGYLWVEHREQSATQGRLRVGQEQELESTWRQEHVEQLYVYAGDVQGLVDMPEYCWFNKEAQQFLKQRAVPARGGSTALLDQLALRSRLKSTYVRLTEEYYLAEQRLCNRASIPGYNSLTEDEQRNVLTLLMHIATEVKAYADPSTRGAIAVAPEYQPYVTHCRDVLYKGMDKAYVKMEEALLSPSDTAIAIAVLEQAAGSKLPPPQIKELQAVLSVCQQVKTKGWSKRAGQDFDALPKRVRYRIDALVHYFSWHHGEKKSSGSVAPISAVGLAAFTQKREQAAKTLQWRYRMWRLEKAHAALQRTCQTLDALNTKIRESHRKISSNIKSFKTEQAKCLEWLLTVREAQKRSKGDAVSLRARIKITIRDLLWRQAALQRRWKKAKAKHQQAKIEHTARHSALDIARGELQDFRQKAVTVRSEQGRLAVAFSGKQAAFVRKQSEQKAERLVKQKELNQAFDKQCKNLKWGLFLPIPPLGGAAAFVAIKVLAMTLTAGLMVGGIATVGLLLLSSVAYFGARAFLSRRKTKAEQAFQTKQEGELQLIKAEVTRLKQDQGNNQSALEDAERAVLRAQADKKTKAAAEEKANKALQTERQSEEKIKTEMQQAVTEPLAEAKKNLDDVNAVIREIKASEGKAESLEQDTKRAAQAGIESAKNKVPALCRQYQLKLKEAQQQMAQQLQTLEQRLSAFSVFSEAKQAKSSTKTRSGKLGYLKGEIETSKRVITKQSQGATQALKVLQDLAPKKAKKKT